MLFQFKATIAGLAIAVLVTTLALACGSAAAPTESEPSAQRPAQASAQPSAAQEKISASAAPVAEVESLPSSPKADTRSADLPTTVPITSATDTPQGLTNTPQGLTEAADPAPTSMPTAVPPASPSTQVDENPDWARELKQAGIRTGVWETDFSKHNVPYNEIFSGGVPRDGIPPIDNPKFVAVAEAGDWLEDLEPVIALEIEGEAKAYPLQILTWHEIVNDAVGGVPVAVTFCPLCNSALVFDRTLNGEVYDFGVSGNLRNSDLIMWDRQTQTWWQQLTGEAIVGELTGTQLDILPATIAAWQDFRDIYPEGMVLSRDTGHGREYGKNPYVGYDEVGQSPFLFFGEEDERLLPTERVAALTVGQTAVAFPFSFLESEGVVHHQAAGQDMVVFFRPGVRSALDQYSIADSRRVGSTGIFLRELDGQTLTFAAEGADFVDEETGTTWDIFGQGVSGPLAGAQLTPVVHANHFWFAWAAFQPNTELVREVQ